MEKKKIRKHPRPFSGWLALAALMACFVPVRSAFAADAGDGVSGQSAGCSSNRLNPGDSKRTINVNGQTRSFFLHVPGNYTGATAVPLIVDYHGHGGNGEGEKNGSGFAGQSETSGFIVAYPDGLGGNWDYHVGGGVDDLGFSKAIIKDLGDQGCIDTNRVYAAGFSQGGGMSYGVACYDADAFAAVVSSSFDLYDGQQCNPVRPISVLSFRGTNDPLARYDGSPGFQPDGPFVGAKETLKRWAAINHCSGSPSTDSNGCEIYTNCDGGTQVGLCTIQGGGHLSGDPRKSWDFLKQFSLSGNGNNDNDLCTPTTITPYVQVDDGDWQQTESVTVDAGATVKFGPQPSSDNTWSWSGCGTSGSLREQTISPTDSCTVTATYTNSCGEQSTQDFTVNIDSVGNQAPVASTSGPYSAMIGAAVQFDASSSTDEDGSIASYSWSFGDGSMGTGVKPTHSYSSEGTYNVTLTVTDDDNAVGSVMTNVDINPANQPPIAVPGEAYSANDGEAVMFDGSGSSDPDGSIVSYAWNFGDTATSTEMNPSHTYAAAGNYTVSLTVTDNQGLTGTAMAPVTIGSTNMQAPVAQLNGPYSGSVAVPIDFNGSGSNDPDGTIVSYEWDFGDGNKMTDSSNSTSHAYSQSGSYTVTLKVTDNDGLMDMETTTATIGMGNVAPVAEAMESYSGKVNGVIKFNGSQSHDQDGSIVNYIWDFGDGTGDSSNNPYPEHSYVSVGTYNVILTVTDDTGAMGSDMTTVTVTSEGSDTGGSDNSSSSAGAAGVSFLFILTIILSLSACGRKEFLERDEVN